MFKFKSSLIILLFSLNMGISYASEQNYINVQVDNKIRIDLPENWDSPNQSLMEFTKKYSKKVANKANIDASQLDGMKIFMAPKNEANIIFTVSYEETGTNEGLKSLTIEDLAEYNIGTKNNTLNGAKQTGSKIGDWVDSHVAVYNGNACINFQHSKVFKGKAKKEWECAFYFTDRILTIHFSYISEKKMVYEPIINHIASSISLLN